jgi:uncharacterized protein YchJ
MANRSNSPTAKLIVKLRRSPQAHKKYVAYLHNDQGHVITTVHFGEQKYQDFTQHNDEQRKKNYIARHVKRENWHDPRTAGFWSKHLLWTKPTVKEAMRNISRQFNIKFI